MDNNNNNDFMSIFNDAHVNPSPTQVNPEVNKPQTNVQNNPWVDEPKPITNENISNENIQNNNIFPNNQVNNTFNVDVPNNEQTNNISNIVNISNEHINEQILEQSEIIKSTGDIEHSSFDEQEKKEEKKEEPINFLVIVVFSIILGIVAFAGFNIAEKLLKPKGSSRPKELVEEAYNFEQSFSAYIVKYNKTNPIKNTIACVSEGDKDTWLNHPDFKFTEDCTQLINEYKQTVSAVKIPSYGIIYINEKGVKNGTHFIYDDGYVCSYNSNEEKLFICEKTE